jgi:hypothetical protein
METGARDFVPEGLDEGSLAVYRQGMQETEPVP